MNTSPDSRALSRQRPRETGRLSSLVAQDLVHLRRSLVLQCRKDVRVRVERQADLRVAESPMIVRGSTPCARSSVAAV